MSLEPTTHQEHDDSDEEEQGEHFITEDDILAEVGDDGDHPMDEDDEDDDAQGELSTSPSEIENNSVQLFAEHRGSVFTVSGHPTEPLAASGGEDDLGYIWDITDGEVIAKLTGHTDSVTCVAWSADGEMISTGGMDGKIRVWRRVGRENYRTWEFLTELQGPDEVMVWTHTTSLQQT
jgi:ribosome assembly protein SQT1